MEINNYKNKFIWIALYSVLSASAYAGHSEGNGGDVVVCRDPKTNEITSVEMADLYEGRTLRFTDYQVESSNKKYQEQVFQILAQLKPIDPHRSERYAKQAQEFIDLIESGDALLSNIKLTDLPDHGYLALPVNCDIEQIAVQTQPKLPGDKRLVINASLWDLLDQTQRAALVLHETVYSEMIQSGKETSIEARYFNALLHVLDQAGLKKQDYFKQLNYVSLGYSLVLGKSCDWSKEYEPEWIEIMPYTDDEYSNRSDYFYKATDTVRQAIVKEKPESSYDVKCILSNTGLYSKYWFEDGDVLTFSNDGALLGVASTERRGEVQWSQSHDRLFIDTMFSGGAILFYPNGAIRRAVVSWLPVDAKRYSESFFDVEMLSVLNKSFLGRKKNIRGGRIYIDSICSYFSERSKREYFSKFCKNTDSDGRVKWIAEFDQFGNIWGIHPYSGSRYGFLASVAYRSVVDPICHWIKFGKSRGFAEMRLRNVSLPQKESRFLLNLISGSDCKNEYAFAEYERVGSPIRQSSVFDVQMNDRTFQASIYFDAAKGTTELVGLLDLGNYRSVFVRIPLRAINLIDGWSDGLHYSGKGEIFVLQPELLRHWSPQSPWLLLNHPQWQTQALKLGTLEGEIEWD